MTTSANLIILYGPPGSGKGTQSLLLEKQLDAKFFDAGQSFRSFVTNHSSDADPERYRAERMNKMMSDGVPILTEDYFHIVKEVVNNTVSKSNKLLIMDKPGGVLVPEAEWLNSLIIEKSLKVSFVHLNLSLDKAVERATNRWCVSGSKKSFRSLSQAKSFCSIHSEPFQRKDDENIKAIENRYKTLYEVNKSEILSIFAKNKFVKMLEVDADNEIEYINKKIYDFIKSNF